jgi:hypothetical protein
MRQVSDQQPRGFAYGTYLHPYTSITTDWRSYLPVSPHRLTTTGSDHALAAGPPKGTIGPGV